MATSGKKTDIELHPDAWLRLERFIRGVAKAGPQHRKPTAKPKAKVGKSPFRPTKKRAPPKRG
jgi:hypothetical protein